jgi:hypothetical protein
VRPILLDEMLSPRIAEQLRVVGADVVAISDTAHLKGTSDSDVLELATSEARALITDNIRDFAPLNASWAALGRTHAGMVFISTKTFPQDRTRVGRITAALQKRLQDDAWPEPGQVDFL